MPSFKIITEDGSEYRLFGSEIPRIDETISTPSNTFVVEKVDFSFPEFDQTAEGSNFHAVTKTEPVLTVRSS